CHGAQAAGFRPWLGQTVGRISLRRWHPAALCRRQRGGTGLSESRARALRLGQRLAASRRHQEAQSGGDARRRSAAESAGGMGAGREAASPYSGGKSRAVLRVRSEEKAKSALVLCSSCFDKLSMRMSTKS